MNAIPTRYNGVQFRSRLEAKWAAMFDLLGWRWEYEPIDLDGYIPDFIVETPLDPRWLVEVKPIVCWASDSTDAWPTLVNCRWSGPLLLVGALLGRADESDGIGSMLGVSRNQRGETGFADLVRCRDCPRVLVGDGVSPLDDQNEGFNRQRWCDCDQNSDRAACGFDATQLWREAGNIVQWRRPT